MFLRILLVCSPFLVGLATVAYAASPAGPHTVATRSAPPQALAQAINRARQAGVPDADIQAVVRLAAQHHYPAAAAAGFVHQLGQAGSRHIPGAAVRNKILEGIAKQAPVATITQVASRWTQAVALAQQHVSRMQPLLPPMSAGQKAMLVNMAALEVRRHGHATLLDHLGSQLAARKAANAGVVLKSMQVAQSFMLHGASARQAAQMQALSLAARNPQQQYRLHQQALAQLRAGKPAGAVIASLHPVRHTAPQRAAHGIAAARPHRPAWHARVLRPVRARVQRPARPQRPMRPGRPLQAQVQAHGLARPAAVDRPAAIARPDRVERPDKIERPPHIERPERPEHVQRLMR